MASRRIGRGLAVVGALALLALAGCGRPGPAASSSPKVKVGGPQAVALLAATRPTNVVIVVLDAARADHFGCYGYPRATTPNVDLLARESVLFRNHFATCSATEPSTASLLTGLHTDTHCLPEAKEIPAKTFTLEQGMQSVGLRTALFTSNLAASPECGIGADFQDIFPTWVDRRPYARPREEAPRARTWRTPEALTKSFALWLRRAGEKPFFAYLHFLPPHSPYDAPREYARPFASADPPRRARGRPPFPDLAPHVAPPYDPKQWADLYDANLRWGDWGVGEVVRALQDQHLLDRTLLVVTADHGEAFGEHGYLWHALAVYDEFVHLPLLIRFPGPSRLTGEVTALTQSVDLLPTLLDLLQARCPQARVQGKSLRPLLEGRQPEVRGFVFARSNGAWTHQYLVRDRQWSLLRYRGGERVLLYDLRADPGQLRNVAGTHPEVVAKLTAALAQFGRTQVRPIDEFITPGAPRSSPPVAVNRALTDRARKELKALGYVE